MPHLAHQAITRLLESIEILHTDVTPDSLFDRMSEAAARAVSTETACFDGFDPTGRIGHLGSYPQDTWAAADFPVLQAHLVQTRCSRKLLCSAGPRLCGPATSAGWSSIFAPRSSTTSTGPILSLTS